MGGKCEHFEESEPAVGLVEGMMSSETKLPWVEPRDIECFLKSMNHVGVASGSEVK